MTSRLAHIFSSCQMMQGISSPLIARLQAASCLRTLKGHMRIEPLELRQRLFFVASGEMRMLQMTPDGQEHLLHRFKAGEFFCLAASLSGKTCQSVMINAGQVELMTWSMDFFQQVLVEHPELHHKVLQQLADQVEKEREKLMLSRCCTVEIKLASYLLQKISHSNCSPGSLCAIDLKPISLMAQELGVARETAARCIQRLARQEGVNYHRGILQFKDVSLLEDVLKNTACCCAQQC